MRFILTIMLLMPALTQAASIQHKSSITCISDKSSLQGRHKEYVARKNSEKAKSWFSEWILSENFGDMKSKIYFTWKPKTPRGPAIDIDTTDKAHNLIQIRSQTKNSLIVVSSASNPMSTESWTFVFNFQVEDFHTYFVTEAKILTHDNTMRGPTTALVPGLVSR